MEGFIERVQEKISRLKLARTRSVRTVLIHSGDPGPAIEASDYFDFIVDAHSWVAV